MATAAAIAIPAIISLIQSNQQHQAAKGAVNAQNRLAAQQTDLAKQTQPYVAPYYQRAGEAFDPAFEHYRALASGDRSQIMGAVAPQLADVNSRYGSLITASRNLAPRSGAGAAYNTDLGFRAADEGQRIIDTERASAYPALSAMAGQAANIGAGAAGIATNAGNGAGVLNLSGFNMGRTAAGDTAASQQQIAQGLYSAWQQYQQGRDAGGSSGGGGNGKPAASGSGSSGGTGVGGGG